MVSGTAASNMVIMNRPTKIRHTVQYTLVPECFLLLCILLCIAVWGFPLWLLIVVGLVLCLTFRRGRVAARRLR